MLSLELPRILSSTCVAPRLRARIAPVFMMIMLADKPPRKKSQGVSSILGARLEMGKVKSFRAGSADNTCR